MVPDIIWKADCHSAHKYNI